MQTEVHRNAESATSGINAREILRMELQRRLSQRPNYSLRAFARALKISPATLSLILSGKMKVSDKVLRKMTSTIDLNTGQVENLWKSQEKSKLNSDHEDVSEMTWDYFTILSEWYHFAILSLLEIKNSTIEPRYISSKLGISMSEAGLAVDRLKRLGVIEYSGGRWQQSKGYIRVPSELSTTAARQFQKQLLVKALHSLENDPAHSRDVTSMTFAMNSKHMKHASELITKFRRSLTHNMESMGKPDGVYNLTIQLCPVTKEAK